MARGRGYMMEGGKERDKGVSVSNLGIVQANDGLNDMQGCRAAVHIQSRMRARAPPPERRMKTTMHPRDQQPRLTPRLELCR